MVQNPGMTMHPLAEPMSAPAHPALTDSRAIGVLLVHGFTGSPASMRPWAEALNARGYAVEVPLLPGHGTRWQDLNAVAWTSWYETAAAALDRLLGACESVVVTGLSMGGSVALRLAEERPGDVAGLVLVNPFVSSTRKELVALPVLHRLVPSLAGVVNDMKLQGQDEHGYHRLPLTGLFELTRMWKAVVPDLPKVTAPLLYFQSREDHVIDQSSKDTVLTAVSSRDVTHRPLGESYHVATLDHDAETIFSETADFVARVTR